MKTLNTQTELVFELIVNKDNVIESVTRNLIIQTSDVKVETVSGYTIFLVKSNSMILAINKIMTFLGDNNDTN